MLAAKGLNPIAVAAVRRSIENDRALRARHALSLSKGSEG